MTQKEINEKNIYDTLKAVEKLPEEHQEVINNILGWMEQMVNAIEANDANKAIKEGIAPLIGMLAFKFIGQYVAEHLPMSEALAMIFEGVKDHRNGL